MSPHSHVPQSINPEVLAALRAYFGSHATSTTFHDPEVQAAVDEMRADVRNISKYRNNEKVMQVRWGACRRCGVGVSVGGCSRGALPASAGAALLDRQRQVRLQHNMGLCNTHGCPLLHTC
jgi:hypothetical protein